MNNIIDQAYSFLNSINTGSALTIDICSHCNQSKDLFLHGITILGTSTVVTANPVSRPVNASLCAEVI